MKRKLIYKTKHKKYIMFYWSIWFYILILINSVMSFALITFYKFDVSKNSSIYIFGMILFMGVTFGLMISKINTTLRMGMKKIIDGINDVAEGNLDIELEFKNAGEYELIYSNFNKMVKELKCTKLQMENFINDFSHEFKTPITSIKGFAELLIDTGISEEEKKQYLEIIVDESKRLAELSENTLLLSKLESKQIVTYKEVFSIDEQIKRCAIILFRELDKKKINLNMNLQSVDYYGNPNIVCQIWINIINNAIKFTHENGEITIVMVKNKENILVDISDNGIGMDEETIKHIFRKYYQRDSSHITKGNGLGLSIVQRIVKLCNGEISVISLPGSGSTFSVSLPIVGA